MSRTITLTHDGVDYEAQIMTVRSTRLGNEDHGIWTFALDLNGSGHAVAAGGYPLMNAHGMHLLKKVVETVGARSWEDLAGKRLLALFPKNDSGLIAGIAHIEDEDKVLIFKTAISRLTGGPISNGMLLAMNDDERQKTIAELSPVVRRKLAHIAALGAETSVREALDRLGKIRDDAVDARSVDIRKRRKLERAEGFSALAVQLTLIDMTEDM